VFKPSAERAFLALPKEVQRRLDARLLGLQDTPRPPGVTAPTGAALVYRLRVGDDRVLYGIHDDSVIVLVLTIGHRREVYRQSLHPAYGFRRLRRAARADITQRHHATSTSARGFLEAMSKSVLAAPDGARRPCSHS
jgi:mRNA interferase RelE/StbE